MSICTLSNNTNCQRDCDTYYDYSIFNTVKFEKCKNENEINLYKLKTFLIKLVRDKQITREFFEISMSKTFRNPITYFLPKTHRPDFLTNLKFRPIITSYCSFSSNLSKEMALHSERFRLLTKEHLIFSMYYNFKIFVNLMI